MAKSAHTVSFSFDLEDHRPDEGYPARYRDATESVVDLLADYGAKATVFTVWLRDLFSGWDWAHLTRIFVVVAK